MDVDQTGHLMELAWDHVRVCPCRITFVRVDPVEKEVWRVRVGFIVVMTRA